MSYYGSYASEHADQQEYERLKAQYRRRQAVHEGQPQSDAEREAHQKRLEAARRANTDEKKSQ